VVGLRLEGSCSSINSSSSSKLNKGDVYGAVNTTLREVYLNLRVRTVSKDPRQPIWAMNPHVHCCRLYPPSSFTITPMPRKFYEENITTVTRDARYLPFISNTQLDSSKTRFTVPRRIEGWVCLARCLHIVAFWTTSSVLERKTTCPRSRTYFELVSKRPALSKFIFTSKISTLSKCKRLPYCASSITVESCYFC